MDEIAEFLIEKETITGKEFMQIYRRCKGIPEPEEKKNEDEAPDEESSAKEEITSQEDAGEEKENNKQESQAEDKDTSGWTEVK